ncbi:MAG: 2-C-methyl-D-erythritol 4-phosphate cytidylyltransferase [Syntrophomonadaceae bacterium]|nr:2-C-methyl-D-erythritol 4-phosphate cytidylyltransferase [Bacillota bacterium]
MVSVILSAAGKGTRLGFKEAKPFVKMAGCPLLTHSLALFEEIPEINSVILVVSGDKVREATVLVSGNGFKKVAQIIPGGAVRQGSVSKGLAILLPEITIVLVHDADRPLISKEKVVELIAAGRKMATIPALPVFDTLKEVKEGLVIRTVDRSRFYAVQTPQSFPRKVICAAYRKAKESALLGTDDACIVESAGFPVQVIPGEQTNIKITYPEDLLLAEALLRKQR